MAKKSALIAGASGLVGGELLSLLLNGQRYERVFSISRRPLGIDHPKLIEIVCDFDRLDGHI
jgi:N-acetyl-gamma-glutamylphosphate reductase